MEVINGGPGPKTGMGVTEDHHALVDARTVEQLSYYAGKGECFCLACDFIPLTTLTQAHALFYLLNDSKDKNIKIGIIRSSATMQGKVSLIRNPSQGTLIDTGTDFTPKNVKFDSGAVFQGVVKQGVDGLNLIDGERFSPWLSVVGNFGMKLDGLITLAPGNSIGIEVEPLVAGEISFSVLVWQHTA